jgi:hypothetical protein|tara:strand:- start:799 stop:1011 length:213 start_codon:yes stop_codon:yes gene_type:complete
MSGDKKVSVGPSLGVVIFIVFLVLKLAGIGEVSNWSWWWIVCPLFIPIIASLTVLGLVIIFAFIVSFFKK